MIELSPKGMKPKKIIKKFDKNTNPIIKKKKGAIRRKRVGDRLSEKLNMFFFKEQPASDAVLEDQAVKMLKWALKNEDALVLSDWFIFQGISTDTWYKWLKRNAVLKKAHELVKEIIGSRREKGAMNKIYDAGMVKQTAIYYSTIYGKASKLMAELRSLEITQESEREIHIHMPEIKSDEK